MKIYHDPSIEDQLDKARAKFNGNMEKILGVGLNQPCEPLNSSSRKIMFSTQSTHRIELLNPEVPLFGTGYEAEFARHSASLIKTECEWTILAKIEKYSKLPGHHYYLIVMNQNGDLDMFERVSYHHQTETYGYLYNTSKMDCLNVGDTIPNDYTLRTSTSFDSEENHMDGVNLRCGYMALAINTEDPVVISESAAKKLAAPAIKKVEIIINDNDIPLNLYGDSKTYKIFPDVGEYIKNGILGGVRKENKDEMFFSQAMHRLSKPMISDITYKIPDVDARVMDINVYSNKPLGEDESCYDGQLRYYIEEDRRFCQEFVEVLRPYIDNTNYHKSYKLSQMYDICEKKLSGAQYIIDGKVFSNMKVEIYVLATNPLDQGDKISNRCGGKGVVAEVRPDHLMPAFQNGDHMELIWNFATCHNRLNVMQLVELSLNYISKHIVSFIDTNCLHIDECVDMIIKFYDVISPEYANSFKEFINSLDEDELVVLIKEIATEEGLYISAKPISECADLDTIRRLYQNFPWIKPQRLVVPQKGSNGSYRYILTNKSSVCAAQYVYRLKQCAEEKHSATSLSATNIRGENTKSRASKEYTEVHSSTPIRMGEMETNIGIQLGAEIWATNLLKYSTSPVGRRSVSELLTGDPYTVDVHLDPDAKSRSVEKFNCSLKTMGLALKFIKKLKRFKPAFIKFVNPVLRVSHERINPVQRVGPKVPAFIKVENKEEE